MSVCLERELDDFEGARDGAMQNYKVVREEGRWSLMFQSRKRNQGSKTGEVLRWYLKKNSYLIITANTDECLMHQELSYVLFYALIHLLS